MTEAMIVEAVRAASQARQTEMPHLDSAAGVSAPDPASVVRFQTAMGVQGPGAADPVPLVSEASAAWQAARSTNQELLHRIQALAQLGRTTGASAMDLVELQYDVMNLSFQQEVVTKIADKSSSAIPTLFKNQ